MTGVVKKDDILPICKFLYGDPELAFDFLTDICGVDYPGREKRFEVVYHLYSMKRNKRLRIKTSVGEGEAISTVESIWKAANWLEREVYDMMGIPFEGHSDLRRILTWEGYQGHPLRKDFPLRGEDFERYEVPAEPPDAVPTFAGEVEGERYMTLNMGPQHPATHGVLRLVLKLDGEVIVDAVPYIGHLHRGVEKLGENMTYTQAITLTDRLDYTAGISNNLAYILTVEKLLGIEVPKRAQYIRVMLAELQRIAAHLLWLASHALDMGAMTVLFYTFRERETVLDILEHVTGARLTPSFLRIGGLAADLPDGIEGKIRAFLEDFPRRIHEYETLLTKNIIWLKRTKDVGVITAQQAINWGLTGPVLRGSGVKWDIRKVFPYSSYGEFDFEIPIGEKGDVYDRYMVRLEEMRQSARIVRQTLDRLPDGDLNYYDPKVTPPNKDLVEKEINALIRHFKLMSEGISPFPGEVYASTENPKGELGWYLVSDGSNHPYRYRIRPPCFVNLAALPEMVKGHLVADVVAVIGSIDIVLGEIDR
ncbi:MAG: NADH dehydrogenase (quinone) subunit D [Deltaproteobacteria bacterium]|nr:NADH dehydrogenase (quinone) subunit D [Deltaproteobacteria bacterium]